MKQKICTFVSHRRTPRAIDYLLYLPTGYGRRKAQRWPLILFLHGAGERGDDPTLLMHTALPRALEDWDDFPFIVVSPQCPTGSWWQRDIHRLAQLLASITATLAADPARVYLTGVSMGGYATWHLGACYPERFAALAPICGYGLRSQGFPERVCALRDVPVWAFHGEHDEVVPLEAGQSLVDALRVCGGEVQLTVYPQTGHDAWTRAYADPALYAWLLAQVKRDGDEPRSSRRESRR
jgi:predicted peptidase